MVATRRGSTFTIRLPRVDGPADVPSPKRKKVARSIDPQDRAADAASRTHPHERRTRMTRVLIVEDEPDLADPLAYLLRREGYDVEIAEDGPTALAAFRDRGADIVLLDLMLPGMSGTEVCRQIRAALEGADHHAHREGLRGGHRRRTRARRRRLRHQAVLVARAARADARRAAAARRRSRPISTTGCSTAGGCASTSIVTRSRSTAREINMPLKEFELLEVLMRNAGRVLTRGQLIDRVWGSDYFGDTKTLDVHIKRIRSRIEEHPASRRCS